MKNIKHSAGMRVTIAVKHSIYMRVNVGFKHRFRVRAMNKVKYIF